MNKKRFLELTRIIGGYLGNETSHGVPHILRVYSNFTLFKSENPPVSKAVLKSLELSVLFHDIGRSKHTISKWQGHPATSAQMLEKLFRKEISDFSEYRDLVIFAVAKHEEVLGHPAKEEKDICWGLLRVFDLMDAIGFFAIFRGGMDWGNRIPLLPQDKHWSKKKIEHYLKRPEEIKPSEREKMMKNSILAHLLYNYCTMMPRVVLPVQKYLGPKVMKDIEKRLSVLKNFISELSKLINCPLTIL